MGQVNEAVIPERLSVGTDPAGRRHDMSDMVRRFDSEGYAGPLQLFSREQCRRISSFVERNEQSQAPLEWGKGYAAASTWMYRIACNPVLLDHVQELIGNDVMLWGASIIRRRPGQIHPWHTDIETSDPRVRTVSVWIGLRHTNRKSSLRVVSGSHRFGKSIQEVAATHGVPRWQTTPDRASEWAHEIDPGCRLVVPDMTDGDAMLFDGRLWHGSENENTFGERVALLLQYAAPESPIRIPDLSRPEWPFRQFETPRPPCLMVRGSFQTLPESTRLANNLTRPPVADPELPAISAWIRQLDVPLEENATTGWKVHPIFKGSTPNLDRISCHASSLAPGTTPHPPHSHADEELLIMLSGEADLVLVRGEAEEHHTVSRGQFSYYPAAQMHTLVASGTETANYLMFKWDSDGDASESGLSCGVFDVADYWPQDMEKDFEARRVFEGGTRYLRRLQCHVSRLDPGGGYAPHIDAHDVAIVVLEGDIVTDGQRLGPNGVAFFSAGTPHGIKNPGTTTARYVVFEFHRAGWVPPSRWSEYFQRAKHLAQRAKAGAVTALRLVRRLVRPIGQ